MKNIKISRDGVLDVDDKRIKLTREQRLELGLSNNPFDVAFDESVYLISTDGYVRPEYNESKYLLARGGKACKVKVLMDQRKLRKDLDDLIFKFAVENKYLYEHTNLTLPCGFYIGFDWGAKRILVNTNNGTLSLNDVYFDTRDHALECVEQIVIPYWEEYKAKWDWNYNY